MHRPTTTSFLALALVLTGTTACGGGPRPSTDQVADAIRDGRISGIAADDADCSAAVLVESDLSDAALLRLVNRADRPVTAQEDQDALEAAEARLVRECDLQQAAG